jgi:ferrous iron transport protein B
MTATAAPVRTLRVALMGNPNTGKTTLFNILTGFRGRVGNYAGVTVERKVGPLKGASGRVEIIDLPGSYSLAARSADEMVAVDALLGHLPGEARPDRVLVVVDASNLERNLYLATQIMEIGLPVAIVLNMVDVAKAAGIEADAQLLSERLGVPVFPAIASRSEGIDAIRAWAESDADHAAPEAPSIYPETFAREAEALRERLEKAGVPEEHRQSLLVRRALLEADGMAEERMVLLGGAPAREAIDQARAKLSEATASLKTLEPRLRYAWIRKRLDGVVARLENPPASRSDRIDAILLHRVWGTLIFAGAMLLVFQAIYTWSGPFMDWIEGLFGLLAELVSAALPEGPLASFLTDGVIAGVGGVLVFLPQILILFFFIAIMEDCGYMARAAFLMDRLLSRCGLSGRSFIPMLSSFACAIPGIMATRVIEDRRDRLTTILVAPLMSCSARLPVYALLIGAFVPPAVIVPGLLGAQALTLFLMYGVGLVAAVVVALILKKTLLRGATPPFLMELPPYKRPHWPTVFHRMAERGWAFTKRAGTIIFAVSVLIWAMTYYPRPAEIGAEIEAQYAPAIAQAASDLEAFLARPGAPDTEDELREGLAQRDEALAAAEEAEQPAPADAAGFPDAIADEGAALVTVLDDATGERDRITDGAYLRQSILGRMGHFVEPVVRPLGWDWKIGMAAIASFPAREVIVATLGIIYDLGADTDEESADLREKLQTAKNPDGTPVFNLAVALSIMVFFALCAQCAATLAVIKRETNSWGWAIFSFVYMTTLAYVGALVTYQVAIRIIS